MTPFKGCEIINLKESPERAIYLNIWQRHMLLKREMIFSISAMKSIRGVPYVKK